MTSKTNLSLKYLTAYVYTQYKKQSKLNEVELALSFKLLYMWKMITFFFPKSKKKIYLSRIFY